MPNRTTEQNDALNLKRVVLSFGGAVAILVQTAFVFMTIGEYRQKVENLETHQVEYQKASDKRLLFLEQHLMSGGRLK